MSVKVAIVNLILGILTFAAAVPGQRIAILVPEETPLARKYSQALADALETDLRVVDSDLAAAAYSSLKIDSPFNQSVDSAKSIAALTGCDHVIFLKARTDRRSSSARANYYQASAFVFVVDGRTGRLQQFVWAEKQDDSAAGAERMLLDDVRNISRAVSLKLKTSVVESSPDQAFDMFDPDSKTMRPAMPYRRIKPEYSNVAFLFDVKATVDAEVSIDEKGNVKKIDVVRWAGFGLDDAVIDTVNRMNWRPGERNGKPFPMRVLLRYNFTKIDKDRPASELSR